MPEDDAMLYALSTGEPITSLIPFSSPIDEYRSAFEDRESPFLNYYTFPEGKMEKLTLTRGEFWDLAGSAAVHLSRYGLAKGDRVVHGFSSSNFHDLAFRLAAVLTGCVPVTINWHADDNERIVYKAKLTGAKLMVYDDGFAGRVAEV